MKISSISRVVVVLLALFFIGVLITGVLSISAGSVADLFRDQGFLTAVLFSLKTSLVATVFAFVTGVPAGFFLARNRGRISRLLDVLFDIPIVIPPLIVGVLLLTFFNLPFVKSFYSFIFTMAGAVVAQFFVAVPFTVKSAKSAFELVPPVYERIAMTLGARPFRSFYDTTFKIAFPGILSGLILTWLRCVGEFGATLMVGGGIPGKTENIPVNVYLHITSGDFDKGITASITAVVLSLLCIVVINALFLRKRRTF
ncbi:MAG: ABC transporter permease subunit [Proteobacteria bacterium]|nr:ABC transporter permease subunit [Pseudomonadota bacterium]